MNWREGVLLAILFYEIINTCYSIEVVIKFSLFKAGINSPISTALLLPNLAINNLSWRIKFLQQKQMIY